MPEATFPTPLHSQTYDSGPVILKYLKRPKAWAEVTVFSVFEDGGRDVLEHADNAPQYWELDYDGLEDEDANILDEFWESHRLSVPFTFIEPRDHPSTGSEGLTVTGCYFVSFERDHNKVWIQSRKIVIAKYPA
jgi:hypothetical protein